MAESEEELKILLMKVKEESEKVREPESPYSVLDRFSSVEVPCVQWGLGTTVTACVCLVQCVFF